MTMESHSNPNRYMKSDASSDCALDSSNGGYRKVIKMERKTNDRKPDYEKAKPGATSIPYFHYFRMKMKTMVMKMKMKMMMKLGFRDLKCFFFFILI